MANFFSKLRSGLTKTRTNLVDGISKAVTGKTKLDDELLEEIEERLIAADIGIETTMDIVETLRKNVKLRERNDAESVMSVIKEDLVDRLSENGESGGLKLNGIKPYVVLITGVNGVGKTTSIGKIANVLTQDGKKVLIGAADTFRAAASQQLEVWAERAGAEFIKNQHGADPAAIAFDTMEAAASRDVDVAIVDTAGRLHTSQNLMEELKKIQRVVTKRIPDAPH